MLASTRDAHITTSPLHTAVSPCRQHRAGRSALLGEHAAAHGRQQHGDGAAVRPDHLDRAARLPAPAAQ
jgi:hypothetical protein